ncbi:hypothetical protein [Cystobacter fuscus]|nr:hypothetical protein [Cystobacter fuscus]
MTVLGGMGDKERLRFINASLFDDSGRLSETRIVSRLRSGLLLLCAA